MNSNKIWLQKHVLILLVWIVAGCSGAPPMSQRLSAHTELNGDVGPGLLVDVCLNEDVIGNDDYFVVKEARAGASALADATETYLKGNGFSLSKKLTPFVCGALHDASARPKRVAAGIGEKVSESKQPFGVTDEYQRDQQYVDALQNLSTYLFQSAVRANGSSTTTVNENAVQLITKEEAKSAALHVKKQTGLKSLIVVGVTGNSLSTGKAASLNVVRFVGAMAASLAVGPIPTGGSSSMGVVFVPGGPVDSWQMAGGLIDLQSGSLITTRIIHGGGDPIKPNVLSQSEALDLLLREMVFSNARQ